VRTGQNVEQVCLPALFELGGGYKQSGLSDHALIGMIARNARGSTDGFTPIHCEHFLDMSRLLDVTSYRGGGF